MVGGSVGDAAPTPTQTGRISEQLRLAVAEERSSQSTSRSSRQTKAEDGRLGKSRSDGAVSVSI